MDNEVLSKDFVKEQKDLSELGITEFFDSLGE